jgi:hypothetical protein
MLFLEFFSQMNFSKMVLTVHFNEASILIQNDFSKKNSFFKKKRVVYVL